MNEQIIEIMPQTAHVQKLTEILQPYEFVAEKEHIDLNDSENEINDQNDDKNILKSLENVQSNHTNRMKNGPKIPDSEANSNKLNGINIDINNKLKIIPDDSNEQKNINLINIKSTSNENSHNNQKSLVLSDEDEDENFVDTSDSIIEQEEDILKIKNQIPNNNDLNHIGNNSEVAHYCNSNNIDTENFSSIIQKYGGELNQQTNFPISNYQSSNQQPFRQSRPGSSLSNYGYRGSGGVPSGGGTGGGGGYPPNDNYINPSLINQDTNRQILLILLRLQQDTNSVITRLSYLEATVLSLQV